MKQILFTIKNHTNSDWNQTYGVLYKFMQMHTNWILTWSDKSLQAKQFTHYQQYGEGLHNV